MRSGQNPVETGPRSSAMRSAWSRALGAAFSCLLLIPSFRHAYAAESNVLRVQGSTTFNARLIDPYRADLERSSGVKLNVIANKSIWGLIALIERRADLAMISSSLEGELEALTRTAGPEAGKDLRAIEIARSRVAFAVHPSNPLRRLSDDQLRAILVGEIRNWKDVGGADQAIRVVATQDGGGTVVAVRSQLLGGRPIAAPDAIRLESAMHVVKVVSQEPGAIAIAQLSLTRSKGLPEISTANPIEQLLCLVTLGAPTPAMLALIDAAKAIATEKGL
ncbi:MAG: substrate-binding domain-containing protein [Hyphomicrobium sp.]